VGCSRRGEGGRAGLLSEDEALEARGKTIFGSGQRVRRRPAWRMSPRDNAVHLIFGRGTKRSRLIFRRAGIGKGGGEKGERVGGGIWTRDDTNTCLQKRYQKDKKTDQNGSTEKPAGGKKKERRKGPQGSRGGGGS